MKAKKWLTTAVAVTMVGSVTAGCGGGNASEGSSKEQAIKINITAEPPVLDSSKGTSNSAFTVINALHEGLYRNDKSGQPVPGLAKDMPKISEDGLTYTIELRDNATWSDGKPVTANDFVYSYKRTLDPATQAQYSFMVAWIKGGNAVMTAKTPEEVKAKQDAVAVKAINDKTIEIKLEKPVAFFTELLGFPVFFPQREDFVQAQGEKYGADADKIIGAGPYTLTKWDHGQTLEFVKNEKYWDAANVKLEKVTLNIIDNQNTGLNLYETGAADVTDLKGEQLKLYEGKPDIRTKNELTNSYIMFQQKKQPALANAKIRQALGMAIDRQAYVDTVMMNGSVPSTGLVPNGTKDGNGNEFRKEAGETQPKYDAAKAKQLLEEGLKELGLTALPKMKLTADDTENAKKSLEFIISQWKSNLGYEAIAEPLPHKLRVDKGSKHDFDMILSLWGADYNDSVSFLDMWITGGDFNEVDWSNKRYDELMKNAAQEVDTAKRSKDLIEAEKILMDEMAVAPIYFRSRVYLVRPGIENLLLPSFGMEWDLKWTEVK
ncbi:peptide ABC transporter substrate-binding protein [Paenibacillus sp. N1-5-1-14]|uniref:peptide ABC transporter substrate-binding protein n=1 Tax=Paenibacillus radicibacter TaxID=2972488 RepID=UPI002158E8C3|nr:peptide ABC transporter substrate-binding protein [Paenibacillus radicibacter]MCR8641939.1 peptide ABC transporter substrate-binding protein [Paenibacillus radicibacter]